LREHKHINRNFENSISMRSETMKQNLDVFNFHNHINIFFVLLNLKGRRNHLLFQKRKLGNKREQKKLTSLTSISQFIMKSIARIYWWNFIIKNFDYRTQRSVECFIKMNFRDSLQDAKPIHEQFIRAATVFECEIEFVMEDHSNSFLVVEVPQVSVVLACVTFFVLGFECHPNQLFLNHCKSLC
jgi:hypothetical protein